MPRDFTRTRELLPRGPADPAFVATLLVLGVVVHVVGSDGVTGVVCAVLANLLLLTQGALIQYYWRRWVGGRDS